MKLRKPEVGGPTTPTISPEVALLETVTPAAWSQAPPERGWLIEGMVPLKAVTLLAGAGGTGKSLLSQILATCVATGQSFFGLPVCKGRALYLACEDDVDELHRRQVSINRSLRTDMRAIGLSLPFVSIDGLEGTELAVFDQCGDIVPTPLFHRLRATALAMRVRLIVLDNAGHLFGGNENDRGMVTRFLALLSGLAREMNGAVLLLAHPSKSMGAEFSGSTAWENGVRCRLLLKRDDKDVHARELSVSKANYAAVGASIQFRWHDGSFVRPSDLPPDSRAEVSRAVLEQQAESAFLDCLRVLTAQRENVSNKLGCNYAPKRFERMAEARGISKSDLADAMERLARKKRIEFDAQLWQRGNRHWQYGLREAPSG